MSTLIAYASKYGFTKTCAEILAKKLGENVDICDLNRNHPDLKKYDKVIIGGSVYAGKIRKPVIRFCSENLNTLKGKKLGLFICGIAKEDDAQKQIESSFPRELLDVSTITGFFGGECNYEKMNFLEKFIMKKVTGFERSQSQIAEDNITQFAGLMR